MTLPTSWLPIALDSDFSLYNLPFGIFSHGVELPRVGVAIGDHIIDLAVFSELAGAAFPILSVEVLKEEKLNAFMALGRSSAQSLRLFLQAQLTTLNSTLYRATDRILVPQADASMYLPITIGDYTDFYSSLEHATNVGQLFRPDNPLLPNWKHLPVAYHGRASSIVVSGTPVRRPSGQILPAGATEPVFAPTEALDYELELGFLIGKNSELGVPIPTEKAEDYIFGCVLFNDWSARDIQRWEYQPLGPFLSKNFASSMSPWVVTLDALEACRVAGPVQNPTPLPYLHTSGAQNFDLNLEVAIKTQTTGTVIKGDRTETAVCRTNARHLYWNIRQQLAHHTMSGCNVRVGDLLATGTISGPDGKGCLLELTEGGKEPIHLARGVARTYLQDGDEVIMRGYSGQHGMRVGFGEVRGEIVSRPF